FLNRGLRFNEYGEQPLRVGIKPLKRVAAFLEAAEHLTARFRRRSDPLAKNTNLLPWSDIKRLRLEEREAPRDAHLIIILRQGRFLIVLHHLREDEFGKLAAMAKQRAFNRGVRVEIR